MLGVSAREEEEMAEELSPRDRRRRRAGCAALVIFVVGLAIGYGVGMMMCSGVEELERWPFVVEVPDIGVKVHERLDEMRQMALNDLNGDLPPAQRALRTQVLDLLIELLDADWQSTDSAWEVIAAKCVEEAYQILTTTGDWAACLAKLQACVEELDPPH
jgi:hypothetical protein